MDGGGEQVAVLMEEDDRGGKSAVNESPRSVDGPLFRLPGDWGSPGIGGAHVGIDRLHLYQSPCRWDPGRSLAGVGRLGPR